MAKAAAEHKLKVSLALDGDYVKRLLFSAYALPHGARTDT